MKAEILGTGGRSIMYEKKAEEKAIRKGLKWFCEHYEESIEGTELGIIHKQEKVRL